MNHVFQELTFGSQQRFNGIRRKVQFFSTFAGGVIEALRELGFRLSNIEKQIIYPAQNFQQARKPSAQGQQLSMHPTAGNNIELFFEQQDNDQCRVLIVPFRTDLPYLSAGRYNAQLGLELSRYTADPDILRQALHINSRGHLGSFLGGVGGKALPKLRIDSPPDIKQPGSMTFELRGARLVVSMNVLVNIGKYRLSDFDLDIPTIKADLEAYFYGLEKYLSLLLKTFGQEVAVIEAVDSSEAPTSEPPPMETESEAKKPVPSPAPTIPLSPLARAQTVNLDPNQLPTSLEELETPRKPRPMPESDRHAPPATEPLDDIKLPFDIDDE